MEYLNKTIATSIILFLVCNAAMSQQSRETKTALKSLQNAIAYRQDFINRQQNSEWMQQEYGNYVMHKYSWGLRQKTVDRDQIEIDIRVLQFCMEYDVESTNDLLAGLITEKERDRVYNLVMPLELYEALDKNKERVFPSSKEVCRH